MKQIKSISDLEKARKKIIASIDPKKPALYVCGGTGCKASGTDPLVEALRKQLKKHGLAGAVDVKLTGCHGLCERGPIIVVEPQNIFYQMVGRKDAEKDATEIVEKTLKNGEIIDRLLYVDPATKEKIVNYSDIPFYKRQQRIALKYNGKISNESLEDYLSVGGYAALAKALEMNPTDILEEVKKSGLRGRGGGGFSTGTKWGFCRNAPNKDVRYILCNADEGDPGAFMDRSIMEGIPIRCSKE